MDTDAAHDGPRFLVAKGLRDALNDSGNLIRFVSLISNISLEWRILVALYEPASWSFGMAEMTATNGSERTGSLKDRLPTEAEVSSASEAAVALSIAMERDGGLVVSGADDHPVRIAPALGELIIELLGHVSRGNMVTLVPIGSMLTTQEAADILNVSRPHLTKLLKRGDIEFELVGRHRRVRLEALMSYQAEKAARQEKAMQELANLGQELDKT